MKNSNKLWQGLSDAKLDPAADKFNASIKIDKKLWSEDITASIAHVMMLEKTNILDTKDAQCIVGELEKIYTDLEKGNLIIDESFEDIHSFIEAVLSKRLPDQGAMLHTGRSRNDQTITDLRLYTKKAIKNIQTKIKHLACTIVTKAEECIEYIMPGYTHLQRAQPILFSHHLLAYYEMLMRDYERLNDLLKRVLVLPLGSAALAGTSYPIDRDYTASILGFLQISNNSIDAVSDRDFVIETISACAIIMTHLSRFSEELIVWASLEFNFIKFSNAFSTGSSIMPQKKNPDIAELTRGKTGRVYGDLMAILTIMKGLPLAYNKDMQEDKEVLFDSIDTVVDCLTVFAPMLETVKPNSEAMLKAANDGFINATDCADYLTSKKGLPFRMAYSIVGQIVKYCIENKLTLETLSLEKYRTFSLLFDESVYKSIDMNNCLNMRTSFGGTAKTEVIKQISRAKKEIELLK
ncbi:MAG: argininosuccinate lyase [Christensenellaceae bacterium]|jgi:argininosuccinate lyase|nr:argininosuccinate lyase [Christensenellaceae bacterium]